MTSVQSAVAAAISAVKVATDKPLQYGTAGFRAEVSRLPHAMHRCGFVAVLRSFAAGQRVVGVMITASHNPASDNGVKLVDPSGGMLEMEFEAHATSVVNAGGAINPQEAITKFGDLCQQYGAQLAVPLDASPFRGCTVLVGRDTRETSASFAELTSDAVRATGATAEDYGVVTTPQLHFAVWYANKHGTIPPVETYFTFFSSKLTEFCQLRGLTMTEREVLVCDCAHGVGALHATGFAPALKNLLGVHLEVRNGVSDGQLNHLAGSEYVQKERRFPEHFGPSVDKQLFLRCCAIDGDADRLVYFTGTLTSSEVPTVFEGDKIAALLAKVVGTLITTIEELPAAQVAKEPLRICVVQTAYANGASTEFLKGVLKAHPDLIYDVACAKTGVKHLHHKAVDYDIGIYFESNGHGTIIKNQDSLLGWGLGKGVADTKEFKMLTTFLDVFNAATGDALADILAVELSLRMLDLNIKDWIKLYEDLPSVQLKVAMPRTVLNTLKPHPEHEMYLVAPVDLQERINSEVSKHKQCRAFVRPSGTEDVCRLYVEAAEESVCREVAQVVQSLLTQYVTM